jgi:hypothetical protein
VRSQPIGLALFGLLLLAPACALAQATPKPEAPGTKPSGKKPAPAFTDDDLSRYREERLRGEAAPTEPPPPKADGESVPAAVSKPPGTTPTSPAAVELLDLNRTLPADARAAAEAAGGRFVTFFGVPVAGPLIIPLRYFPDAAAFRDHLARNIRYAVPWTGYYDPVKREIVVGDGPDYRAVLIHEINHFVFDTAFDDAPVWLREGLAEYFEAASASPEGLVVADQPRHRRQLAEWLRTTRQPDLRQLLALNRSMWRDHELEGSQRVRALSWSVVDFLMSSPGGRKTLHEFMATLKDQRGLYSLEALNRTFPGGVAAFERQWLEHVEARTRGD